MLLSRPTSVTDVNRKDINQNIVKTKKWSFLANVIQPVNKGTYTTEKKWDKTTNKVYVVIVVWKDIQCLLVIQTLDFSVAATRSALSIPDMQKRFEIKKTIIRTKVQL